MPKSQSLRLASECSNTRTYVPATVPDGYRFTGWQVFAHNVVCDEGFAIRFRQGLNLLTWEADGPETFRLDCTGRPIAQLNGKAVFHRVRAHLEKVWACVGKGGMRPTVVAFQKAGVAGAGLAQLERMVSSAHRTTSDRAPSGRFRLPSRVEVDRLANRFGQPFFLPRSLPDGFVFGAWAYRAHDPNLDDRSSLYLTFGRAGRILDWGVYSGVDRTGVECPTKQTSLAPKPHVVIDGVATYLIVGIHGGSVWRCIPAGAVGNSKPIEVAVWYSIQLDSTAMERRLAELVARARLVR